MAGYKGTGVRFGPITPGSAFTVDTNLARQADRLTRIAGQFQVNAQEALTAAHYEMAYTLQQYQVEALEQSIADTGRKQQPGQRLQVAIKDERNRQLRANGWAVGIYGWLDQSPAGAYWRVIEEGTGPYTTQGLFFEDRAGQVPSTGGRTAAMLRQGGGRLPTVEVSGIDARRYMAAGVRRWSADNIRSRAYAHWFKVYGFGDYLKLRRG